jgi:hypothetical protein
MENRTFYAMVLGALAVAAAIWSVASVSFASAQTSEEPQNVVVHSAGARDIFYGAGMSAFPEIEGSIDAGSEVMSKAETSFIDAAQIATDAGNGTVIGGDMTIEQGYLVYVFRVLSGEEVKTVIVDAGDGEVLHVSEGMEMDALSAIGGHGGPGFAAVRLFEKPVLEEATEGEE